MPACKGPAANEGHKRRALYVQDTLSYYDQFQQLKGCTDLTVFDAAHPKPSQAAAAKALTAYRVPLSGVVACRVQRPLLAAQPKTLSPQAANAHQRFTFFWRIVGFVLQHLVVLTGCWSTFTWGRLAAGLGMHVLWGGFGIVLGYHRLLAHRSFKTYRAVEYVLAYLGMLAMQGPPIEWASNHRIHHLETDTPLDLHSPLEGIFHAYFGWLLPGDDVERPLLDRSNVDDLRSHAFYRFLEKTWVAHLLAYLAIVLALGGWAGWVWYDAFPVVFGWHVSFGVNVWCHLFGRQPYDTGDESRNNCWMSLVTFGESWHNTHHAFASSARHGLEWYEPDLGYCGLRGMEALGLVWDIKLPSEDDRARKARRTD